MSWPAGAFVGAAAGGVACGRYPWAFPVAAGALPAALLGATVPLGGRAAFGAGAGALLGGIVGLAFARFVAAAFASAVGGVLLAAGAVAAAAPRPLARELAAHPFALAALALVCAIAGTAYQLARAGAPPAVSPQRLRQRDAAPPDEPRER